MGMRGFFRSTSFALILAACSNGDGVDSVSDNRACGAFTAELRIEGETGGERATLVRGEQITFELRITNGDSTLATLNYDGCPAIRFVVFDSRGPTVFDSLPEGTACTMLLRPIDYAPHEFEDFGLTWNQTRGDDGSQVPPGEYTVSARDRSVECAGRLDRVIDFAIR